MARASKILIVSLSVVLTVVAGMVWEKKAAQYERFIRGEISAELASNETLKNTDASVARGVVLLTGSVKLLEDQRQAVKKVSGVEHVRAVESRMVIDTRRVPDLQLRLQLK